MTTNAFDLEKAKRGAKLSTRSGKPARIICWDRKDETYPIVAVTGENDENINSYTLEGRCDQDVETSQDLVIVPERKVGWINIYKEFDYYSGEIIHPTLL